MRLSLKGWLGLAPRSKSKIMSSKLKQNNNGPNPKDTPKLMYHKKCSKQMIRPPAKN